MKTTQSECLLPRSRPASHRDVRSTFNIGLCLIFFLCIVTGYGQSQTFTSSGTFTVPAGVTTVTVEAWGGGGAGGGAAPLFNNVVGGGGSGGTFTRATSVAVNPGQVIAVTVGAGGTGVTGDDGNNGGTSTFASAIPVNAVGGNGGKVGNLADSRGNGGAAPIGVTYNGGAGGEAPASGTSGGGGGGAGSGAHGGNASGITGGLGGGGAIPGGIGANGVNSNANGANASGLAAGGSGGRQNGSITQRAGGNGFRGQVIVYFSCPTYGLTEPLTASGPFCNASAATVTLSSSTLPSGNYVVSYTLSGATSGNHTANISFTAGGPGTAAFNTPALNNGVTNITITKLQSGGCESTITTNNTTSVTVNPSPTASAGPTFGMCETEISVNVTSGATASNYASIEWTTSGTGTFSDADSLTEATYFPSIDDVLAGSVTITLTANGLVPCTAVSSNKTLEFTYLPVAIAGGSDITCTNEAVVVEAIDAQNGDILWTSDGGGTITNETTLTPTYTPALADAGNIVTLTMTVSNIGCGSVSDTHTISVVGEPSVDAGTDLMTCADAGALNITAGASAGGYASVLWTSSGTGSFSDANSLSTATYTPSEDDIANGSVTLTLTAFGNSPCANVQSSKALAIMLPPTASAGGSQTICVNQSAVVSGASASNGTISWTEDGGGSITAGANTLTPTYTPSSEDAGNTVTLTMTVSNPPCADVTATYTIDVLALPTAFAGPSMEACANAGAVFISGGATASNQTAVLWTSSGTGNFINAESLDEALYAPSPQDIEAGSVQLTLTAIGNSPCNSVASSKTLTILPVPTIQGVEICQGAAALPLTSSFVCTNGSPVATAATLPKTGASAGTGTAWSSPGNILTNNDSNATASVSNFGSSTITTQNLNATNFQFAIPANATIVGIEATIGRYTGLLALGGYTRDVTVRLLKGGAVTGTNKAVVGVDWPTAETPAVYGGPSDMWGTTWTPAQINANNFGLTLVATVQVQTGITAATVDYMTLTVSYTLPGSLRWYTQSSGGTPIGTGQSFNPVGVAESGLADTNTPGTYTFYAECETVPGCRTATTYVINALPEVSFSGLESIYCEDGPSALLSGNYSSGTFTGPGITSNGDGTASFNPVAAGVGNHQVTYTYTDENSCTNSVSASVEVKANVTYFADDDNDGYGDANETQLSCMGAPAGFVLDNTDCDDADPLKHTEFMFYADGDGDGVGAGDLMLACAIDESTAPEGYSLLNTDCDDSDATKFSMYPFCVDADGDGFGAGPFIDVCAVNEGVPPIGYSLFDTDCNDTLANVYPGSSEIGYNLADDDCDGLIDEGFPPKVTQISASVCNTTLPEIDTYIYAFIVTGAQGYRWRVTTMSGPNAGQVQFLDTALRSMKLTWLANYAFDTDYKIEVAVYYAGFLQPFTPSDCIVSTPATTTQLGNCDTVLNRMDDIVYCHVIPFVTGYRFKITDPENPGNTQMLERPIRDFRMSQITAFQVRYNKTYNVEVALRNTDGNYLPEGTTCQVTTPLFPTTSIGEAQCEDEFGFPYQPASMSTPIYALSYPGAIKYAFRLTGPGMPGGAEVVKLVRSFTLNDFVGMGLVPGETYNVNVRLIFDTNDIPGPYGKTCSITVPGAARMAMRPFEVTASPNPFSESVTLEIAASSTEDISVAVYDMAGRRLEHFTAPVEKVRQIQIGQQYPAGVYNVILRQDEQIKSVRLIKR